MSQAWRSSMRLSNWRWSSFGTRIGTTSTTHKRLSHLNLCFEMIDNVFKEGQSFLLQFQGLANKSSLDGQNLIKNLARSFDSNLVETCCTSCSDAANGWAGWALAHPEFGSSVNPITARGADYAYHITASPPRFESPAACLLYITN